MGAKKKMYVAFAQKKQRLSPNSAFISQIKFHYFQGQYTFHGTAQVKFFGNLGYL